MISPKATGPAAELTGPVTTGRFNEPVSAVVIDVTAKGYVTEEFFASGTASAFEAPGPLSPDGRWTVTAGTTAPYRTRFVVRRPADPAGFNGTVLVEWFNVSGGLEASPDWTYLGPHIVGDGYAYVGVSAQAFGVGGGTALLGVPGRAQGSGLVVSNPERYGTLGHPGDEFAFDMFTQIGRALRGPRLLRDRRRARTPSPRAHHRAGGVPVRLLPHDLHRRRAAHRPGVRRLLRAQPGGERRVAQRCGHGQPRHADGTAHPQ